MCAGYARRVGQPWGASGKPDATTPRDEPGIFVRDIVREQARLLDQFCDSRGVNLSRDMQTMTTKMSCRACGMFVHVTDESLNNAQEPLVLLQQMANLLMVHPCPPQISAQEHYQRAWETRVRRRNHAKEQARR